MAGCMGNHVHIVATPRGEDSLARAVGRMHFCYTQYINRFHKRSGFLSKLEKNSSAAESARCRSEGQRKNERKNHNREQ